MSDEDVTIYLGPPGTGKTHKLLSIVEDAFSSGIQPDRVGYFSFTKKAAQEARDRASVQFEFDKSDLPFFSTLHSLCFKRMNMDDKLVFSRHIKEFAEFARLDLTKDALSLDSDLLVMPGFKADDRYVFHINLARARMMDLDQHWRTIDADADDISLSRLTAIKDTLESYKYENGLHDFSDMLQDAIDQPDCLPEFDLLIIDEAQDLSMLQWTLVEELIKRSARTCIAGDDDQAIYRWNGADVDYFQDRAGKRVVLGQSYRVPRSVQTFANSIIKRVAKRYPKEWDARDFDGKVTTVRGLEHLDMSEDTWYILVRNRAFMADIVNYLRGAGYYYSIGTKAALDYKMKIAIQNWEAWRRDKVQIERMLAEELGKYMSTKVRKRLKKDAEFVSWEDWGAPDQIWHVVFDKVALLHRKYMVSALRRNEKLSDRPRIRVDTIHGVKGGEADNVVLFTDLSWMTFKSYQKNPDEEHRLFYVGATRAKENLFIHTPTTNVFYEEAFRQKV